jgi:hypothetical protein
MKDNMHSLMKLKMGGKKWMRKAWMKMIVKTHDSYIFSIEQPIYN